MKKLVSEELREVFGNIYLEVIFQNDLLRASCLRRASDKAVLSYHIVAFNRQGIDALGETHATIVAGAPLGETIRESGMAHDWKRSGKASFLMPDTLRSFFKTEYVYCSTEVIEYKIKGIIYACICEFYNPEYIPLVKKESTVISKKSRELCRDGVGPVAVAMIFRNLKTLMENKNEEARARADL